MTAGAITDPDLVLAIDELGHVVRRLERVDQMIVELDPVEGYARIVQMKVERHDLRETLRVRAEKLNLTSRALAIIIGTASRLRTPRKHQLPTLAAIRNHIETIADAAARDQAEAEADAKVAAATAYAASLRLKAGRDAITYLEASRA